MKYTNLQLRGLNLKDSTIVLDDNLILHTSFQEYQPLTDIFSYVKIEKKEEKEEEDVQNFEYEGVKKEEGQEQGEETMG